MSSVVDPIADMLTRMRNRLMRGHESVTVPVSVYKGNVLACLLKEGYIASFEEVEQEGSAFKQFLIKFKYDKFGQSVINKLDRISKPSLRKYIDFKSLRPILKNGVKTRIISTHKGVMSDRQILKENLNIGGEVLFTVE